MKKKSVKIIFCLSLVLILSLSLVSAGWFDWVGKITGRAAGGGGAWDTDYGINYSVRGTCTDDHHAYTDYCTPVQFELREYYSEGDSCLWKDYDCSSVGKVCSEGVCVDDGGVGTCVKNADCDSDKFCEGGVCKEIILPVMCLGVSFNPCYYLSTTEVCNSNNNCRWSVDYGKCVADCNFIQNKTSCNQRQGYCSWEEEPVIISECKGTATACSEFHVLECLEQNGCRIVKDSCSGTAKGCSQITSKLDCGETANLGQIGCSWSECTVESKLITCEGSCGAKNNNCGQEVDCGGCGSYQKCQENVCVKSDTPSIGVDCKDSDGGVNYYESGTCTDSLGSHNDECLGGRKLREYSCFEGKCVGEEAPYFCLGVCESSACSFPISSEGEDGCPLNGKYIQQKTRMMQGERTLYCDPISSDWEYALPSDSPCVADYECETNVCIDRKCTSITDKLNEQTALLKKIWCFLTSGFSSENPAYGICIGESTSCEDTGDNVRVQEKCTSINGQEFLDTCEGGKVYQYECGGSGFCKFSHEEGEACPLQYECVDGACILSKSLQKQV